MATKELSKLFSVFKATTPAVPSMNEKAFASVFEGKAGHVKWEVGLSGVTDERGFYHRVAAFYAHSRIIAFQVDDSPLMLTESHKDEKLIEKIRRTMILEYCCKLPKQFALALVHGE
jgi:hypothetical protein